MRMTFFVRATKSDYECGIFISASQRRDLNFESFKGSLLPYMDIADI